MQKLRWVGVLSFLSALPIVAAAESALARNEGLDSCVITIANAHNVQLLHTFTDHTAGAWNAVFSHDGRMLGTCAQDAQVLIHDLSDLDSVIHFIGHTEWVLGLAFSPDDQFLASTGTAGFSGTQPGVIKIWDIATAAQVRELPGHTNGSWSLDFQESTGILASCGKDRAVKLWDISTGDLLNTLTGHTGWVLSVDFHPNQDLVASSSVDRSIRIWNSQTGDQVDLLTGHTNNVGFVKFSPDGLYLASGADDQTVRLWNVADGTQIWSVPAGQGWVNGVNFSPNGELLLTCGHDGSVVLRKTLDGTELIRLTEHSGPVLRGSFNPSGTLFATASWDNTVRLWGIDNLIDTDQDGVPDGCDMCEGHDDHEDSDLDSIPDSCDNCLGEHNPGQEDCDGDGDGDACDCFCGVKGDVDNTGAATPLDVTFLVCYVYKTLDGRIYPACWNCPRELGDFDCSGGVPNPVDVVYLVSAVYKSQNAICDACGTS